LAISNRLLEFSIPTQIGICIEKKYTEIVILKLPGLNGILGLSLEGIINVSSIFSFKLISSRNQPKFRPKTTIFRRLENSSGEWVLSPYEDASLWGSNH
jgi:hypothetical protein